MKKNRNKAEAGQSLFEALLALAVFIIAIVGIAHIFFGANYSAAYSVERSQALLLAREGIEAVRSIRDDDFANITATENGDGLLLSGGNWTIQASPDEIDGFTRTINITSVDDDTWQVESTVTWTSIMGTESEASLTERLTNWRSAAAPRYVLTLSADPPEGGTVEDDTRQSPYEEGAEVAISAVPVGDYYFVNWTTEDGGSFEDDGSPTTTYTMPGNDAEVTATFGIGGPFLP